MYIINNFTFYLEYVFLTKIKLYSTLTPSPPLPHHQTQPYVPLGMADFSFFVPLSFRPFEGLQVLASIFDPKIEGGQGLGPFMNLAIFEKVFYLQFLEIIVYKFSKTILKISKCRKSEMQGFDSRQLCFEYLRWFTGEKSIFSILYFLVNVICFYNSPTKALLKKVKKI